LLFGGQAEEATNEAAGAARQAANSSLALWSATSI
jgi:hypothetical protein